MPGSTDLGISAGGIADGPARRAVECLLAIALYNFVELVVLIQTAFRRRQGLYYWSFVAATWGIAVYSAGFLTKDLSLIGDGAVYGTLIVVGWTCMVTGQSLVLWSRMHLLVRNKTTLRVMLAVILVDAVVGHVPTSVVLYGSNSSHPARWLDPYAILERFHVTLFFLQELAISTIYIVETTKLLRTKPSMPRPSVVLIPTPGGQVKNPHERKRSRSRSISSSSSSRKSGGGGMGVSSRRAKAAESGRQFLMRLIYINVLVVVLDMTIVALEYAGLYVIQTAYKGMVYSVKLKLEFSILNSLVEMTRAYHHARQGGDDDDSPMPSDSAACCCCCCCSCCCSTSQDTSTLASGGATRKSAKGPGGPPLMTSTSTNMPPALVVVAPHGSMNNRVTFSRLTQTIDEDGQIRYMGGGGGGGGGMHNNTGSSSRTDDDNNDDGGSSLYHSTHSRPESVYNPTTAPSRQDQTASPAQDTMMNTPTTQFVIRRDRREDWEEKSDLDELVLEDGIQSVLK